MTQDAHPARGQTGRWTRRRRIVQLSVAAFYLALPFANAMGLEQVAGTLASLKVGPFDLTEPAAGLSAALAAGRITATLAIGIAPVVLLALVLGPVFCSWACPWGLVSEGIDALRQRARPRAWPARSWLPVRRLRWAVLGGLLALGAFAGSPIAALVSAPRLLSSLPMELIFLRILAPVTGGLLLALTVFEVFGPRRLWCRSLCPVGALANFLRTPKTLRVGYDPDRCLHPRVPICHSGCRWGLDPRAAGRFDACTNCLACVDHCPSGALVPTFVPRRAGASGAARERDGGAEA
jgi:ferredoxin-type protein NapH